MKNWLTVSVKQIIFKISFELIDFKEWTTCCCSIFIEFSIQLVSYVQITEETNILGSWSNCIFVNSRLTTSLYTSWDPPYSPNCLFFNNTRLKNCRTPHQNRHWAKTLLVLFYIKAGENCWVRRPNKSRAELQQSVFEDFGGVLCKEFIVGREPVSNIHYTRPGTCINHPLH